MPVGLGKLSTARVGVCGVPCPMLEKAWPDIISIQKGCFVESRKDDRASCLLPDASAGSRRTSWHPNCLSLARNRTRPLMP